MLPEAVAQRWIDEVVPLAVALLRDDQVRSAARSVRIRARAAERTEDGPYGGLMLTWPERHGDEAVIHHLVDCRKFLSLYDRMLADLGPDQRRFRTVTLDGSRLRIAVTNDVLQLLAPGPERSYSMIRHHALMFFAATLWLTDQQRRLWTDLYRASLGMAGRRYGASRAHGAPRRYLDQLERKAFSALSELAASTRLSGSAAHQAGGDGERLRTVLDYMHAANAAVALLIDRYRSQPLQARTRWLMEELAVGYRADEFLVDAWDTAFPV
jgi:hypothetical protein